MTIKWSAVAPRVGRWVAGGATAVLLGTGCAELPEEAGLEEELEAELDVEGHEQALIPCKAASLSGSPDPNPSRAQVTLTAAGVKGCTPEYLFQYSAPGSSTRVDIGTWSSASSAAWLPPQSGASGAFKVFVNVRPSGSAGAGNKTGSSVRIGDACSIAGFDASPASPQLPGGVIDLAATSSCSGAGATALYRFRVSGGGTTRTLRNWDSSGNISWDTADLPVGTYALVVDVRRSGNAGIDHSASKTFTLGGTCAMNGVSTDPPVSSIDELVSISADASCSGGTAAEYTFDYRPAAGGSWTLIQDWGASSDAPWDISALAEGTYSVRARTRASGTASISGKTITFRVGGLCQSATIETSIPGPAPSVALTSSASCTSGTPEYLFEVSPKVSPSAWSTLADWSASDTLQVEPGDLPPGRYKFRAHVRAQGSSTVVISAATSFEIEEQQLAHGNVLLVAAEETSVVQAIRNDLLATGAFTGVEIASPETLPALVPPSVETMLGYDAVLVWTMADATDPVALGDNLADYYDAGGRVVVAFAALGGYSFAGRFADAANGYILIDPSHGWSGYGTCSLGNVVEPGSALMSDVSAMTTNSCFLATGPVANGGTVVANWDNGVPAVVRGTVQGRNRVDLNLFPLGYPGTWSGDVITLMKNALLYE